MASLALKINYRAHKNGTVSCVVSTGSSAANFTYAGDLTMSEDQFKFFRETLHIGAMALNGVTHLEINEVLSDENSQL